MVHGLLLVQDLFLAQCADKLLHGHHIPSLPPSPHNLLPAYNTHRIGKDILGFHAIYSPVFLLVLNFPLPRLILTHPHWAMNIPKMCEGTSGGAGPFFETSKFDPDATPLLPPSPRASAMAATAAYPRYSSTTRRVMQMALEASPARVEVRPGKSRQAQCRIQLVRTPPEGQEHISLRQKTPPRQRRKWNTHSSAIAPTACRNRSSPTSFEGHYLDRIPELNFTVN